MNSQTATNLEEFSEDPGQGAVVHNPLSKAKILMVDDEAITMEVVQAFLEEAGYQRFVLIDDSLQAIEALESEIPDILLLDLVMPGKSGFQILAEVRAHPDFRHLPIVVLTSSTDTQTKLKALDLGATDFLSKPVDPSELVLRVRNTLTVKAYQDQLANYDPLTNLPNRRMFMKNLRSAINKAGRTKEKFALLNIDIDQFDKVNDTLGIGIADEMLVQVADRIEKVVRNSNDLGRMTFNSNMIVEFSRFESGEFSLLLYAVHDLESAASVAERICKALKAPISVTGMDVYGTVSIGIAGYPNDSEDGTNLLKQASSAKDYAHRGGGDNFQFFSKDLKTRYAKRISMETRLRKAIANEGLSLNYQPKIDVATNRIVGVEALLRWHDDELGSVPPGEFVKLAEESDLIIPMGNWVVEQSCSTLKEWQDKYELELSVALNLSARQFHHADFLKTITRIIRESHIESSGLVLELTESLLIDDADQSMKKLARLRETGSALSIDDFGTGYSSFSYLHRLPVDELKIDRSFVSDLGVSKASRAIASSMIYMAHSLELKTVAEGVETQDQLDFLNQKGCDVFQGYYFSKPKPKHEVEQYFQSHQAL
ncbi:MAG: EAL domain-containing protein [Gammaproteobacteria bacterium]|nr:EAL domain-containing protein [Gammaproteobacteria bacterium]